MTEIRLGELIRPAQVLRAGSREFPLLSMTMHQGLVEQESRFKKRIASQDLSEYKVVERGQLVVGFPIDEGVLDFQELHPAGIVSPAYSVWDLIDKDRVDRRYLKRALKGPRSFHYYRTKLRGTTARRRSLPADVLLSLPIHLPPLPEQRRIAAILDQADAVRAKRRQVLAHLDTLTQSIFYSMFGHPTANHRGTPIAAIGAVASVLTGNSPSRANPENFGTAIEWIKSDNLGGPVASEAEEWLSPTGQMRARIAPAGSILVTCIAGSPTSIGKASLVDRMVAFNQQINAILPSPCVDSTFLLWQIKAAPELVRAKSTGGMKGLVNKSTFQSIEVLLPSLSLQQEFAYNASTVSAQRDCIQRALAADDELFASLQSRAFGGAL